MSVLKHLWHGNTGVDIQKIVKGEQLMFRKIKEHFEYKKAKKMVTIMCLNQYNALLIAQTKLQSAEKEALDKFTSFNENMSIEEITEFVNNVNTFSKDMDNPKSREKLYNTVAKYSTRDNSIPSEG